MATSEVMFTFLLVIREAEPRFSKTKAVYFLGICPAEKRLSSDEELKGSRLVFCSSRYFLVSLSLILYIYTCT